MELAQLWTVCREGEEIRSLTDTWSDRQKLFENVAKVKHVCLHFVRNLHVWRLNVLYDIMEAPALVEQRILWKTHFFFFGEVMPATRRSSANLNSDGLSRISMLAGRTDVKEQN